MADTESKTAPHMGAKNTMKSAWHKKYAARHRPQRILEFPAGVAAPQRVRVYRRGEYHLLQWWDPEVRKTLNDRVDGDLIDAIARAREIDRRLADHRGSGHVSRRLSHRELVTKYVEDLDQRADAGEIAVSTRERYGSALDHYLDFSGQPEVSSRWPWPGRDDREFALRFVAYLNGLQITSNGHANTVRRPMHGCGCDYVVDVVRAVFQWASDPDRGHLLPHDMRNPFRKASVKRRTPAVDIVGEPPITIDMACDMFDICDDYQLRLFAPILLWGLRAGESSWMFHEKCKDNWFWLGCIPELNYHTKGMRDKRLPIIEPTQALLFEDEQPRHGLVHQRRDAKRCKNTPLVGASLDELIREYQARCQREGRTNARRRKAIRNEVMRAAGAIDYDAIHGEYKRLAKQLKWPPTATLRHLRHLFNVSMENGGLSERERQYLMGQTQGKQAIRYYTHLNRLQEHYENAVQAEMASVLDVIKQRLPKFR